MLQYMGHEGMWTESQHSCTQLTSALHGGHQFHVPAALLSGEKAHDWIRSWVGHRTGVKGLEQRTFDLADNRTNILGWSAHSLISYFSIDLTLEGPCIIFCNIYTFQRDTQFSSTDCLLMLRCQLYMFRAVTVHPQELHFRCCMCRLWYVVRTALSDSPAGTKFEEELRFFLKR